MSDTYTQLHIQFIFAVKFRAALIHDSWRDELHKYITGIVQANNHKLIQINSEPDHLHLFCGMRPHQSVSDLMQVVKCNSSKWIDERGLCKRSFAWQGGYGAFSYSKDEIPAVVKYIQNQRQHHQKISFLDEYRMLLKEFEIEFDEKYIFHPPI